VRLGDPLTGPVAAVVPVPATGDPHTWAEVTAPVTGAAGTHDLYLVLDTAGARVATVAFARGDG
jgi:beta-glucosidase